MYDVARKSGRKREFSFLSETDSVSKKHSAIRNGSFTTVLADERVYGFARENEKEIIEIFVNDGDSAAEITVENARSIFDSKGKFFTLCAEKMEK